MIRARAFPENKSGWMITFADLITLLLALFVLIFSMSSLDSAVIRSISSSVSRDRPLNDRNRGDIPANLRELAQLVADTGQVHQHEGRIKDLLFPRDLLPLGVDKGTLETSFRVREDARGVAFVLADDLLFSDGSSRVSATGREILASLAPLLEILPDEVQILAFYAGAPAPDLPDDYAVAGRHALAALGVFINRGLDAGRFSVSAYGEDRAGLENAPAGVNLNRVEILLKTGKKAFESAE